MGAKRDTGHVDEPCLEIAAQVEAKSLRFECVPETDVAFDAGTRCDSASGSERQNLPEKVEPGVTYRDVRVRWHAAAWVSGSVDPT